MTSDQQSPVFVLGQQVFGTLDGIMHTAKVVRNKNSFQRLKRIDTRERIYAGLSSLTSRLRYNVVACAIRKDDHLPRYGGCVVEPYWSSLQILVKRFLLRGGIVGERNHHR